MERLWTASDEREEAVMTVVKGTSPGVEAKVAAGSSVSAAAGIISWILVTYVFRNLPDDLKALLPALVATVLGAGAAWTAKHTPRAGEVMIEVEKQLGEAAAARQAMTADECLRLARAASPAGGTVTP